MFTHINQ